MRNVKQNGVNNKANLFPVIYEGKEYYEEDCNELFLTFYTCQEALNSDCGVYVAGGMSVYPDGEMKEY